MKKFLLSKILVMVTVLLAAVTISAQAATTVYKIINDFSAAGGEQGYNGWYYRYKTSTGEYADMTWDGSKFARGGNNVNKNYIMPGANSPTAIVWRAPYTGMVRLRATNNTIYRSAANPRGGDVELTLRINDDIQWEYTLPNSAENGKGTKYTFENVFVKEGDLLYHEVDCGTNTASADVYWKPEIHYTAYAIPKSDRAEVFTQKAANVFIAQYKNGELKAVNRENAAENQSNTYPVEIQPGVTDYKLYIWDKQKYSPLCEVVDYTPPYINNITTIFDGQEFNYPIMLSSDYPCMEISKLAKVVGGVADGSTLTIGDKTITYAEDSRLAEFCDGHLMLEASPISIEDKLYVPLSSLLTATGWTVEYKRFDNQIIIETGTNYPDAELTVYAKDYGAVGDGEEDDREALLAAFNAAAGSGKPVKLELESGRTYRVSEKQDAFALFDLDNISNLTIEGNGSKILFERPTNSLVNIEGCTNIKVNNLSAEYEEHVTTHGRIKSIDVQRGTFIMEIPENMPLPSEEEWAIYYNPGEGPYVFGQVMDKNEDRMKFLTFDHLWINSITKVSGRDYKVEIKNPNASYMSQIETGDRFVYKRRWTAYDFGEFEKLGRPDFICVSDSKDITFDGVKTTGSLLMLAPVSGCDGRVTFKNCELVLKEGALITTNADGIHATSNRFGIIVENCVFRNSLDDFINTNQHAGKVLSVINNNTFEVDKEMYYRVGDQIRFFDSVNHKIIGYGFIKNIEKLEKQVTEGGQIKTVVTYKLTLDREVSGAMAGDTPTLVYNMSAANNGSIIRNNRFINSRRHAYIIRAENTLVENNYMENNGGASLEAANEIYGTSNEGAFPSSLTIRGNVITGDGITARYRPLRVYSWEAKADEQKAIDGVLLEDNIIDVRSAEGAIKVSHADNLYIIGNKIRCGDELKSTVAPVLISNSDVKLFDGLDYDLTGNASVAVSFDNCNVDESNIKNIKSVGSVTVTPYEVK